MVQNKKEEALKEIGVDRGAAHGGDLQGRGCTNLIQHADHFFRLCLEIDMGAFNDPGVTVLASETEILVMNRKFKELAILLERLMSFMMLDHDEVDEYR